MEQYFTFWVENVGAYFFGQRKIPCLCIHLPYKYHRIASRRTPLLVAHPSIFRIFMKRKFDAYVQWTFDRKFPKLNSKLVYCSGLFGMLKKILISHFTTSFILMAKSWWFVSFTRNKWDFWIIVGNVQKILFSFFHLIFWTLRTRTRSLYYWDDDKY